MIADASKHTDESITSPEVKEEGGSAERLEVLVAVESVDVDSSRICRRGNC